MALKLPKIEKHYEILELLFNAMPYVFWKDKDGKYQGGNQNQATNLGFSSPSEFIGKTIYEILPDQQSAKLIDEIDNKVMRDNISVINEEKVVAPTGKKTYLSQKSPIHNEYGEVIGMLGFAMDITVIKMQEELITQDRNKLIGIAAQVAHDIKSPLASLLMLIKFCQDIPEKERIALREAAMSIQDIANNLLTQFQPKTTENNLMLSEEAQAMLASAVILQLLAEKKLQYQDLAVKFEHQFSAISNFAFIKIEPSSFKRMLSNIINNSVDACNKEYAKISISLESNVDEVRIVIQDNGKGMPIELIDKIKNNIAVTQDKEGGHGIGLVQVREALGRHQGELEIESIVGQGTKVTLTFPKLLTPKWIAEEIKLGQEDEIIILDDDHSIHKAWDTRFKNILKENLNIKIRHFSQGHEARNFITALDDSARQKIFLLTDYELLKQDLNGLDVISQTHIKRSVLVTSHYADKLVLKRAAELGTKILPKLLASEIPITIDKAIHYKKLALKKVDLIVVDDNKLFSSSIKLYLHPALVDCYQDPHDFLQHIDEYPKNVKIFLDNDFNLSDIDGLKLAEILHGKGYTSLYLISGTDFHENELPHYLTSISKSNIKAIQQIATAPPLAP
ncbi:MAG: PAS domain-containing sensor histidine kinase [Gammaproteobacteria bacterium]|nr:PAS domain-containing sensor histidine kinase [Gammaproteobacteria bacterium]